jgi:hypothetical protein
MNSRLGLVTNFRTFGCPLWPVYLLFGGAVHEYIKFKAVIGKDR